ncbi:MAG: PspC domain-containing protein [Bacteroidetes bacterium]|nr:PspC domain-containing protein [Bacteroidota bacterium]
MNKTININLSGMVFNIEENAYQLLKDYLQAIKNKFKNEEGCDEIIADIEARLAELLKVNIHAGKQVLIENDITQAINIMGKPDDFGESTPEEKQTQTEGKQNKTRRVFRDGDNKTLGGVCSGIAAYFDTDPLWIRVLFLVLFFGFGTGFFIYIILWIIIPEAKTTAQKLEMRGEPIDMHTISKTVKEEAEQLKNRLQNLGEDMRKSNVGGKVGNLLYQIFHAFFNIISKVVGLVFTLVGLCVFALILCILFNVGKVFNLSIHDFFYSFVGADFSVFYIKTGLFLFLGIPFIMLMYKGTKLLLSIRGTYLWLNITAGTLWFMGLVMCLYVFMHVAADFSEETALKQRIPLLNTTTDTLIIQSEASELNTDVVSGFDWDRSHWYINTSKQPNEWWGKAKLTIIPSENDSLYAFVIKSAHGKEKQEAAERAKRIWYNYKNQNDTLLLDKYFGFTNQNKYRNQEVEILLKVPKNKIIFLDETLRDMLFDTENINEITDEEMINKYWQMTPNGLNYLAPLEPAKTPEPAAAPSPQKAPKKPACN